MKVFFHFLWSRKCVLWNWPHEFNSKSLTEILRKYLTRKQCAKLKHRVNLVRPVRTKESSSIETSVLFSTSLLLCLTCYSVCCDTPRTSCSTTWSRPSSGSHYSCSGSFKLARRGGGWVWGITYYDAITPITYYPAFAAFFVNFLVWNTEPFSHFRHQLTIII